jgi:hypothetical protein
MPLIRIDAIKGRSKEQIRGVLAAAEASYMTRASKPVDGGIIAD